MANNKNWLIYGATGLTGRLIVEEAVRQGQLPILAGRSAEKVKALAAEFGLEWLSFAADDRAAAQAALAKVVLVLNAAGPFEATSRPLAEAALAAGVHYLDISNELDVFQALARYDRQAQERGLVIMPGVGFGTVATNFVAYQVADRLPRATSLEVAVMSYVEQSSQGALKSVLEVLGKGGYIYENGKLQPYRLGRGLKNLKFPTGEKTIIPAPTGDLAAARQATDIANIRVYIPAGQAPALLIRLGLPVIGFLLKSKTVRKLAGKLAAATAKPKAAQPANTVKGHSYSWAAATTPDGQRAEIWLEMGEGYHFTALSSVAAIRQVLTGQYRGYLAPAQAFGFDFITGLEGVRVL